MLRRSTVCTALFLAGSAAAASAAPFDNWGVSAVELTQVPFSRSADDVIVNPFNNDEVFVVFAGGGSGTNQGAQKLTLNRIGGEIVGATLDWESIFPTGLGPKALDMYDANTIYYSVEDANVVRSLTNLSGTPASTDRVSLAGVRNGGGAFDPEGLAINRATNTLYVMTDDGPHGDVMAYTIDPTTKALTAKWTNSHTFETGANNGNDGIVLSDGRVAVIAGTTTTNIYAVTDNGTSASSVNLLGGSIAMPNSVQDLLEYNGYLYVLDEEGMLFAFDASDLNNMTNVAVGSIDLDTIIGDDTYYGGMDVTADGWLLVSTRGGGGAGDSRVFAIAIPEPASLGLLTLGGLMLVNRRRRA